MKNRYKSILVVMMLLTINFTANAQDSSDPDTMPGDPGGAPVAPIGGYVPLMLIAAIGLGYFLIKKQQIKEV
jgi:hypothetical protein